MRAAEAQAGRSVPEAGLAEPRYFFILTPNNAGSTVLVRFLNTSPNTWTLNGKGEGQFLPESRDMMRQRRWDREHRFPWPQIKSAWLHKWDGRTPVLLEKSPPNLMRANDIAAHFPGVRFLIYNRNPYAYVASCLSRYWAPVRRVPRREATLRIARMWVMKAKQQMENLEQHRDYSMLLRYEEFTKSPGACGKRLLEFFPDFSEFTYDLKFKVKDRLSPIRNMNDMQIAELSQIDRDTISKVLSRHETTLEFFGYDVL